MIDQGALNAAAQIIGLAFVLIVIGFFVLLFAAVLWPKPPRYGDVPPPRPPDVPPLDHGKRGVQPIGTVKPYPPRPIPPKVR